MATVRTVLLLALLGSINGCVDLRTTAAPSPTPDVFSFVAQDDRGGWPVTVTVGDFSDRLSDARAATAAELAAQIDRQPMEGSAGGLWLFEGSDRDVLAIWAGGGCDRSTVLTLSADGSVLTIEPRPDPSCQGPSPIYRGAVLTFNDPVDLGTITFDLR